MKSNSAESWLDAMREGSHNIGENETWSIFRKAHYKKIVLGRWVFKSKRSEHGVAEKYKARFVVKRFAQTEGVDCRETFAPTSQAEMF